MRQALLIFKLMFLLMACPGIKAHQKKKSRGVKVDMDTVPEDKNGGQAKTKTPSFQDYSKKTIKQQVISSDKVQLFTGDHIQEQGHLALFEQVGKTQDNLVGNKDRMKKILLRTKQTPTVNTTLNATAVQEVPNKQIISHPDTIPPQMNYQNDHVVKNESMYKQSGSQEWVLVVKTQGEWLINRMNQMSQASIQKVILFLGLFLFVLAIRLVQQKTQSSAELEHLLGKAILLKGRQTKQKQNSEPIPTQPPCLSPPQKSPPQEKEPNPEAAVPPLLETAQDFQSLHSMVQHKYLQQ